MKWWGWLIAGTLGAGVLVAGGVAFAAGRKRGYSNAAADPFLTGTGIPNAGVPSPQQGGAHTQLVSSGLIGGGGPLPTSPPKGGGNVSGGGYSFGDVNCDKVGIAAYDAYLIETPGDLAGASQAKSDAIARCKSTKGALSDLEDGNVVGALGKVLGLW